MVAKPFPIRLAVTGDDEVRTKLQGVATAATGLQREFAAAGERGAGQLASRFAAMGNEAERLRARFAATQAELQQGTVISGRFGNAIQQAGFQVGDFAVQVASGSGVMRPLIQQGSQLISMFGPWGAVLGAAGAVVGALAVGLGGLGNEIDAASVAAERADATQDTLNRTMAESVKSAEDLAQKYRELGDEMRAVEQIALLSAQRKIAEEMDALRAAAAEAVEGLADVASMLETPLVMLDDSPLSAENARRLQGVVDINKALKEFAESGNIAALTVGLGALAQSSTEAGDALAGQLDTLVPLAQRFDELGTEQERVAAAQRFLAGTATEADIALLNTTDSAERAGKKVRTFADILADLNETAAKSDTKQYADAIRLIERTVESGLTDQQRYQKQIEDLNRALEKAAAGGYQVSREAQEALNRAMREADPAVKAAREAYEKQQRERERMAEQEAERLRRPFVQAAESIQDVFAGTFRDVFDGGVNSFADLRRKAVDIMKTAAAEITAALVFEPMLTPAAQIPAAHRISASELQAALEGR